MAFLESKCEYRDGERIPIRPATSRRVTAESPSRRAISHAASRISRRVAERRSARLSRLGKALMVRQYAGLLAALSTLDRLPVTEELVVGVVAAVPAADLGEAGH